MHQKKIKNLLSTEGVCLVKTPNFHSTNNFFLKIYVREDFTAQDTLLFLI
jgi:hypothetical protein